MDIKRLEDKKIITFVETDKEGNLLTNSTDFFGTEYCVIENKDTDYDFWLFANMESPILCFFMDSVGKSLNVEEMKTHIMNNLYENYENYWDEETVNYYSEHYGKNINLESFEETVLKTYLIENKYILELWIAPDEEIDSGMGGVFIYDNDNKQVRVKVIPATIMSDLDEDNVENDEHLHELCFGLLSLIWHEDNFLEILKTDENLYGVFENIMTMLIMRYHIYLSELNENTD